MRKSTLAAVTLLTLSFATATLAQAPAGPSPSQTLPVERAEEPLAAQPWHVKGRTAFENFWASTTLHTNPLTGRVSARHHRYTELATGLNRLAETGEYVPACAAFELCDYGAEARQTAHRVRLPGDLGRAFGVEVTGPDGVTLRSHPAAVCYRDPKTDATVILGVVTNALGWLTASNEVVYSNCFAGLKGSIRYRLSLAGLAQDLLLTESPGSPQERGLPPEATDTTLELMTAFDEATPTPRWRGGQPGSEGTLSFGTLRMVHGRAFLHAEDVPAARQNVGGRRVRKEFITVGGQKLLIESVEYEAVKELLDKLPLGTNLLSVVPAAPRAKQLATLAPASSAGQPTSGSKTPARIQTARHGAGVPPISSLASAATTNRSGMFQPSPRPDAPKGDLALVLDYEVVTEFITNYTFRGDTTYLVVAIADLFGTTTIEGGTVIKYEPGSYTYSVLQFWDGPLLCQTEPYLPAICTSRNDDSVGEVLNDQSGVTNYFQALAIPFDAPLQHLRIAYADTALHTYNTDLKHGQILHCQTAFLTEGGPCRVNNVLLYDVGTAFDCRTSRAEATHLTVHVCSTLADGSGTPQTNYLALTNSLLVSVTNSGPVTNYLDHTRNFAEGSTVFQTVGAGSHYLAAGSTNRNAGTTNIAPSLAADFRIMTTYPPTVLSGDLNTGLMLTPQTIHDLSEFDLGYHYPVLDYACGNIHLNATMYWMPGTAIAWYQTNALWPAIDMESGSKIISQATPLTMNVFVHHTTVQEGNGNWIVPVAPFTGGILGNGAEVYYWPQVTAQFTKWCALAASPKHLGAWGDCALAAWVSHSEFHSGDIVASGGTYNFTNCLFDRVSFAVVSGLTNHQGSAETAYFYLVNSLFRGSSLDLWRSDGYWGFWGIRDTVFDGTTNRIRDGINGDATYTYFNYNAFIAGATRLTPQGNNDQVLTNFTYTNGPLGDYYQVSTNLLNAGSRNANNAGLYHYTVQANQVKETNSTVDIGLHYPACGTNGLPFDTDGDNVPDYLEDTDGNGLWNYYEPCWHTNFDPDYDGVSTSEEMAAGKNPNDPSESVWKRLGHWRFDAPSFLGDAGQVPIKLQVTTNASWNTNAAKYSSVNNSAALGYRDVETNFQANINCRNGSARFWFKPNWSSATNGGIGPTNDCRLLEMGYYSDNTNAPPVGHWLLGLTSDGNSIYFGTKSNWIGTSFFAAPVALYAGRWYQFVFTYTPTNMAFYTNGVLAATGHGVPGSWTGLRLNSVSPGINYWPSEAERAWGFGVACSATTGFAYPIDGQVEELETFNYPLTAQEVARDFPNFGNALDAMKLDTDYDGRSDMLEIHVDGKLTNDASSVVATRLAYFRFNDTNYLGEQGQFPILTNSISREAGWSGYALQGTNSASRLVYRDVETNGWANFCAQKGAVRFWFKPLWSSAKLVWQGAFLYLGSSTAAQGSWELGANGNNQVYLRTATNGSITTNFTANFTFTPGTWYQIAANWSAQGSELYINDALVTNGVGVSRWPALNDRTNGLVIGNTTAGNQGIKGQFEELEVFNYSLTGDEIRRTFAIVTNVDSDLNGTADILEDIVLATNQPFMGVPFVVTGVIEAEQFDKGGLGVAYGLTVTNAPCDYRTTSLFITNSFDKGGGYCVDRLRTDDWMKYTLDVRVGQTYWVEARVAGIGTNGQFRIEFYESGSSTPYTNTGTLTITTTDWANVGKKNVPLRAGINTMKLVMVTNGVVNGQDSGGVGKFNYISIYPSWDEGITGTFTPVTVANLTNNDSSWAAARANAVAIQQAIDGLSATGGVVSIPAGRFYLAPESPNEQAAAFYNTATFISTNNVKLVGAGKANTALVAFNRTTTIFYAGMRGDIYRPIVNLVLTDLTLEGSPHLVSVSAGASGFTNYYEKGGYFWSGNTGDTGSLICLNGKDTNAFTQNLLIEDCQFKNAYPLITVPYCVSNLLVRNSEFYLFEGTNNFTGAINSQPDIVSDNTISYPGAELGFLARGGPNVNLVVVDNVFNGNPHYTTNITQLAVDAADGFLYFQGGGNWFAARNAITNSALEAVHFQGGGPAAEAQCDSATRIHLGSTCALHAYGSQFPCVTMNTADRSYSFVGNDVQGGREAWRGHNHYGDSLGTNQETGIITNFNCAYRINACGNTIRLDLPWDVKDSDWPGAAVKAEFVEWANICGNTMTNGSYGVSFGIKSTNVMLLKNDFSGVQFGGFQDHGAADSLRQAVVAKNILGQGVSYHVRTPFLRSYQHFLLKNRFVNASNTTVEAVLDARHSPVHLVP